MALSNVLAQNVKKEIHAITQQIRETPFTDSSSLFKRIRLHKKRMAKINYYLFLTDELLIDLNE